MAMERGLTPLGYPLAKIARGLEQASAGPMSASTGSQAASGITSPGPTPSDPSSATGAELGATGARALMTPVRETVLNAIRAGDLETARAGLLGLVRLLPGSPSLTVREVLADDWSVKGYLWENGRKLDPAERVLFEPVLVALTEPQAGQITQWLTQYIGPMASRERTEIDLHAYVSLFVEELWNYPAAVIHHALRQWARTKTFRPMLNEIILLCEAEMDWIEKLKRMVA